MVEAFFPNVGSLRVYPSFLIRVHHGSSFQLSGNFLRHIFAKHFLTKSQTSNLQVAGLLKIICLTNLELAFNSKGYLHCVKDYIFECRCRFLCQCRFLHFFLFYLHNSFNKAVVKIKQKKMQNNRIE